MINNFKKVKSKLNLRPKNAETINLFNINKKNDNINKFSIYSFRQPSYCHNMKLNIFSPINLRKINNKIILKNNDSKCNLKFIEKNQLKKIYKTLSHNNNINKKIKKITSSIFHKRHDLKIHSFINNNEDFFNKILKSCPKSNENGNLSSNFEKRKNEKYNYKIIKNKSNTILNNLSAINNNNNKTINSIEAIERISNFSNNKYKNKEKKKLKTDIILKDLINWKNKNNSKKDGELTIEKHKSKNGKTDYDINESKNNKINNKSKLLKYKTTLTKKGLLNNKSLNILLNINKQQILKFGDTYKNFIKINNNKSKMIHSNNKTNNNNVKSLKKIYINNKSINNESYLTQRYNTSIIS
jgi:hypothetical protein